jgi:hypothetical protein
MNSSEDLKQNLEALVQAAVDLANSVADDLREQRSISDETVLLLNDFRKKHDELDTILDVINGIN